MLARTPRDVLTAYLDAMLALTRACMAEAAAAKRAGGHSIDGATLARLRGDLLAINATYLTKRKRVAMLGYGPAIVAEYSPVVKRELVESPRRVVIEVYDRTAKERWRYALSASKAGWLIGSRKKYCCNKCKRWLSRML